MSKSQKRRERRRRLAAYKALQSAQHVKAPLQVALLDHGSNASLERRALREGWDTPPEYKQALVKRQIAIALDKNTPPRFATSAFKAALTADCEEYRRQQEEAGLSPQENHQHVHFHGADLFDQLRTAAAAIRGGGLAAGCLPANGAAESVHPPQADAEAS